MFVRVVYLYYIGRQKLVLGAVILITGICILQQYSELLFVQIFSVFLDLSIFPTQWESCTGTNLQQAFCSSRYMASCYIDIFVITLLLNQ